MERVKHRADLRSPAQGGVLLASCALRAGWPRTSLAVRLREEGWTRVRNGAWAEPGRVIDLPRTLADLLRNGSRDEALVVVESALGYRRVGGVRRPPLIAPAALSHALEAPLLGAARAQERPALVDRDSQSPAETIARLRMHDAGLRPETQAEVHTPNGRRRYLDFLFRAEGLAVEIEGYAYHGTREAHRRDMARFNEITRCPEVRHVLRFGAADVFYGAGMVIEEIRAALVWLRGRGDDRSVG